MYPLNEEKYQAEGLFAAKDFLRYTKLGKKNGLRLPRGIIICYQNSITAHFKAKYSSRIIPRLPMKLHVLAGDHGEVGVLPQSGFGAPAAAVALEMCIAAGSTHFISLGTAGSLQPTLKLGDVVICRKALRDEGTSYHYLPAARYAAASESLSDRLCRTLEARGVAYKSGSGWTTDAVFRETAGEVEAYAAEGVLTVDMEAAALFSVAACRKVDLAVLFTVSDLLASGRWRPGFYKLSVKKSLNLIFDLAVATLAGVDSGAF